MMRFVTISLLLSGLFTIQAQIEATPVSTLEIAAEIVVGADNGGNLYYVSDHTLYKAKGDTKRTPISRRLRTPRGILAFFSDS